MSKGQTVLILDDNPSAIFVLRSVLEFHDFLVLESSEAERALSIATEQAGPIHLLISDVILGTSSGPDTLARIRAVRPNLPVLFVSGYPLEELRRRALLNDSEMSSGRTGFLQKPFTAASLVKAVRELLDGSG
jgi:two-component system cell cycle sensor histidine kinase/response regulator CckA